jgi:hypothetical protein
MKIQVTPFGNDYTSSFGSLNFDYSIEIDTPFQLNLDNNSLLILINFLNKILKNSLNNSEDFKKAIENEKKISQRIIQQTQKTRALRKDLINSEDFVLPSKKIQQIAETNKLRKDLINSEDFGKAMETRQKSLNSSEQLGGDYSNTEFTGSSGIVSMKMLHTIVQKCKISVQTAPNCPEWFDKIIQSITLDYLKNYIIDFCKNPTIFTGIDSGGSNSELDNMNVKSLHDLFKSIVSQSMSENQSSTLNLCGLLKYYFTQIKYGNSNDVLNKIKYILENKLCDTFGTDNTGNIQKDKKKWVIPDGSFASLITAINKNTNSPIDPTIVQYYKDKRSENAWNSSSMQSLSKGTKSFKSWFGRGGKTRKGKSKSRRSKRHCKRRKTKRHRKH